MTTPLRTLDELFGTHATDPEVMRLAIAAAWPAIMHVTYSTKSRPIDTAGITTSAIKAAIEHIVECDPVSRIHLVSNAGSAFDSGTITDYCERFPYGKSLASRLIETHRKILRRRYEMLGIPGDWLSFRDSLWNSVCDFIGRPLLGAGGFRQTDPLCPKSSVADAFLTSVFSILAYGVIGEIVSVKMFVPILELAPAVIPIGERIDAPGTWVCAIVGSPVTVTNDI